MNVLTFVPMADCPRRLHCWSSHTVPQWLEPVLHLSGTGSFWGLATGLRARLLSNAFLKSTNLWNRWGWCCGSFSMMTWRFKICSTVLQPGVQPTTLRLKKKYLLENVAYSCSNGCNKQYLTWLISEPLRSQWGGKLIHYTLAVIVKTCSCVLSLSSTSNILTFKLTSVLELDQRLKFMVWYSSMFFP